jgi:hypothetical protein
MVQWVLQLEARLWRLTRSNLSDVCFVPCQAILVLAVEKPFYL